MLPELNDDQTKVADVILENMINGQPRRMYATFSDVGRQIQNKYGNDPETAARLLQAASQDAFDHHVIGFLLRKGYIEPTHNPGEYRITPLGLEVVDHGGHDEHTKKLENQEKIAKVKADQDDNTNRSLRARTWWEPFTSREAFYVYLGIALLVLLALLKIPH
jgi:hypothetical protein